MPLTVPDPLSLWHSPWEHTWKWLVPSRLDQLLASTEAKPALHSHQLLFYASCIRQKVSRIFRVIMLKAPASIACKCWIQLTDYSKYGTFPFSHLSHSFGPIKGAENRVPQIETLVFGKIIVHTVISDSSWVGHCHLSYTSQYTHFP